MQAPEGLEIEHRQKDGAVLDFLELRREEQPVQICLCVKLESNHQ